MAGIRTWLGALALAVAAPQALAAAAAPRPAGTLATPAAASTVTGTFIVAVEDDFTRGRSRFRHTVRTDDGRTVVVDFAKARPEQLRTGQRVRLHGRLEDGRLRVESSGDVQVLDAGAPAQPPPAKRRVLLLLTDITDANATNHTVASTCDGINNDSAERMFGGSIEFPRYVDGAYLESSFGLEGMGGATYPGSASDVVRVHIQDLTGALSSVCNPDAWANAADSAASGLGVNLGAYQHVVYVLPPNLGCGWGGLGEVGCGTSCRAWEATYSYYPCGTRGAHAHELGHNRGWLHASTDLDNDGVIDSEYGDTSDFMGSNYDVLQHNNGPHKLRMSWVDPATVVDAGGGGTFDVSALELATPAHPQVLRIGPANAEALFVSHRAPIGYDVDMPNGSLYLGRTSVHRWSPAGYNNTELVARLADGETFGDPESGVTVKQVSHDAQGAVVQVGYAPLPQLAISNPVFSEGQSGTTPATFVLSLSAPAPWPVTATVSTFDGSAVAPGDYAARDMDVVTIPAGATSAQYTVLVNGDTQGEGDETFELIVVGLRGATAPLSTATATILDDEVSLSIGDARVVEGDSGTRLATFTATLSETRSSPVTFVASTMDGTAVAGSDYVARTGVTVTIPAGTLTQAFSVSVKGDTAVEPNETFRVQIGNAAGATIVDAQGDATIVNDDGPTLSIADATTSEGDGSQKTLSFVISLSQAANAPVYFDVATADGTATVADSDYVARALAGQNIPAGMTSKAFGVSVRGDTTVEANEAFTVALSNVTGATVFDGEATGAILNDDGPTLSITDVQVAEGDSGQRKAIFTVSLSQVAAVPVTYSIATANGTAVANGDYVARSLVGETIPAGQLTRTFPVNVNGDTGVEANETFRAALSAASGATIFDAQGEATILNDDGPTLSIADVTTSEGDGSQKTLSFVISLSQAANAPVYFDVATADGTATVADSDYVARALEGQNIPAGMTSKAFGVSVRGDTTVEANEAFTVALSNVTGATVFDGEATGAILNDDGPTLSITDVQLEEGDSGQRKAIFTVSLSEVAAVPVTYSIATANGTAVANGDYVARSLVGETIPAGQLTRTFPVNVNGDTGVEANETFRAVLSAASGATIFDAQGDATIVNDDGPTLSIADAAISEGASGLKTLTFVVSLSQATTAPVVFDLATEDGTATVADSDYVARALAAQNIPAGMTSKAFGVSVRGDTAVEADEIFHVRLANTGGPATLRDDEAAGTIVNDD